MTVPKENTRIDSDGRGFMKPVMKPKVTNIF